jgi:hypothetical protein
METHTDSNGNVWLIEVQDLSDGFLRATSKAYQDAVLVKPTRGELRTEIEKYAAAHRPSSPLLEMVPFSESYNDDHVMWQVPLALALLGGLLWKLWPRAAR